MQVISSYSPYTFQRQTALATYGNVPQCFEYANSAYIVALNIMLSAHIAKCL